MTKCLTMAHENGANRTTYRKYKTVEVK